MAFQTAANLHALTKSPLDRLLGLTKLSAPVKKKIIAVLFTILYITQTLVTYDDGRNVSYVFKELCSSF